MSGFCYSLCHLALVDVHRQSGLNGPVAGRFCRKANPPPHILSLYPYIHACSLKGKWATNPSTAHLTFTSGHVLLSFPLSLSKLKAETAEPRHRPASCSVWMQTHVLPPVLFWVTVANHKRVECHLLVHNLNPLSSPPPPIHSPSPADTLAHNSYTLTHHMFVHTRRQNHSLSTRL